MEDSGNIRTLVCQRIAEVEDAMKCLQNSRKSLLCQAYEAKQSILNAFINQRNDIHKHEMKLLMEVDSLLQSKDDAVMTQLSKLNQVLGCLRNCLESPHPCGECLEKYDDLDMASVKEVDADFSSANEKLQDTLKSCIQFSTAASGTDMLQRQLSDVGTTEWLLTPSNNHTGDRYSYSNTVDVISAEWLLQSHDNEGVKANEHFTQVKSEGDGQWLNEFAERDNSLCNYAIKMFSVILQQDLECWLQQQYSAEADLYSAAGDGESDSSSSTSSLGSSCIILPSTATSENGSCYSPPASHLFPSDKRCASPAEVSEWIASCQTDSSSWVSSSAHSTVPSHPLASDDTGAEVAGQVWRNTDESESSSFIRISPSSNDTWLSAPKIELLEEDWQDEKYDASAKMEEDVWLCRKFASACELTGESWLRQQSDKQTPSWLADRSESGVKSAAYVMGNTDWLFGDEKVDPVSEKVETESVDKEWLLVKQQLNKISSSSNSMWLA